MKSNDWKHRARAEHHAALKAMMPPERTLSGLQVWRKLRRIEAKAHKAAEDYCNGDIEGDDWDVVENWATGEVERIFGRALPGFFVNGDPRGYALKLKPNSVEHPLHRDMGGNQILAPEIE